jgi:isoleucyl-tRNA synthetase
VVEAVGAAWSAYDVTTGVRAVIEFCDHDLSNWYVRLNRARFWAPDALADRAALATLYEALVTVARLLAPAAPFTSDEIHRRLTGASVHLAPFPSSGGRRDPELEAAMDAVRRLTSMARALREGAGIRVRQPLARMRVAVPAAMAGSAFDALVELLRTEVNVKEVAMVASDAELVRLSGKPNFRTLGKVYGSRTPAAAAAVAELSAEQLRNLEKGETVRLVAARGEEFSYRPDDVVVEREVVSDWLVQTDGPLVVALDPVVTEALRQEGLARELVNRIQRLRKEAGYDYNTRIALSVSGPEDVVTAAGAFEPFIAGETLARVLETGSDLGEADVRDTVEIDGRRVVICLRRHDGAA